MRRNERKLFDFFSFVRVGSQSYLTTNVYFSARLGHNGHKGDSEIDKAASSATKGKTGWTASAQSHEERATKNHGDGNAQQAVGAGPTPQRIWRAEFGAKKDYLER